jgi:hypothetical protein
MPSMSGEETFGQLRTIRPNVPVILSSGYWPASFKSRKPQPSLRRRCGTL